MTYLEEIQRAIKSLHGVESTHIETVPVTEVFRGQTAWQGQVEVFALEGHPKAKRCYAWGYPKENSRPEIVTVLEIPPVTSPQTAVKIAMAAAAKR